MIHAINQVLYWNDQLLKQLMKRSVMPGSNKWVERLIEQENNQSVSQSLNQPSIQSSDVCRGSSTPGAVFGLSKWTLLFVSAGVQLECVVSRRAGRGARANVRPLPARGLPAVLPQVTTGNGRRSSCVITHSQIINQPVNQSINQSINQRVRRWSS